MAQSDKISLREAAKRGITRLRQEQWQNPFDHFEITSLQGELGLWGRLWSPFNDECNGRDPVPTLLLHMDLNAADWLPYEGKPSDSPEYLAERASYKGCLSNAEKK